MIVLNWRERSYRWVIKSLRSRDLIKGIRGECEPVGREMRDRDPLGSLSTGLWFLEELGT